MRLRWEGGDVSAAWHRPSGDARAALVLAHGAGKDMDDPLLVGLGEGLLEHGIATLRFNFPYREAGRSAPGKPQPDEEGVRAAAELAKEESVNVFVGGKSYGGRMASHVVAAGYPVAGLVFLGYPLHPPGKPERIRDAHLPDVGAPMLFVQGSKDPFATPELLRTTVDALPSATLMTIEGGDHSLKVRGRPYTNVIAHVTAEVSRFVTV
jgi:predicted alpha/beta-hydrolase family hydrolase